jgi:hypothetical protein
VLIPNYRLSLTADQHNAAQLPIPGALMSSFEALVQQVSHGLPPRTRLFMMIELPGDAGDAVGAGAATPLSSSAQITAATAPRALSSVSERIDATRRRHGSDHSLKAHEWAPIVGLSEREIKRAITAGAVPSTTKGEGRDNGARLVRIDDMEALVSTINAVERGTAEEPAWWPEVRAKRRGRMRRNHALRDL